MKKHISSLLILSVALLWGCTDNWDSHYNGTGDGVSGEDVMQQLRNDPELTEFVGMIDVAGYAPMLSSSQTFTVWAPVNGSMGNIDLSDTAQVRRTVINHIARFNIPSSTSADEGVKMYNGKLMYFGADGTSFGGVRLLKSDIRAANGLVHKLTSVIPYAYNFREYIDSHAETSFLSDFIALFDEMLLPSQIPGTTGISGNDSVAIPFNRLLEYPVYGLGSIGSEDSLFTMVVPDDAAWQKAFDEISPYFVTYNADATVADSIQRAQTGLAIVGDLIFRTGLKDPLAQDSIMSTSGSYISDPGAFFNGMEEINASNGRLYLAPALNYDMTETFNKPIHIEAEEQTGRTPGAGTTIYTRNVSTDNPYAAEISGQRYIEVLPTSSSRQPGVTFAIPDVLAGEYDIYASFVPASVTDATVTTDSTRLQFAVTYQGANGRSTSKSFSSNDFVTSGTRMTLIKVTEAFKFPVANYYDRIWYMDPMHDPNDRVINTSIYVSTNVTNAEFNQNIFTRRFRIDRVYLIPVKSETEN